MSDPIRLLDGDSAERELLDAWTSMRAPPDARTRALALGSTAGAVAIGSVAAAKTSAVSAGHAGAATNASLSGAGVAGTATTASTAPLAAVAGAGGAATAVSSVGSLVVIKWATAIGLAAAIGGATVAAIQTPSQGANLAAPPSSIAAPMRLATASGSAALRSDPPAPSAAPATVAVTTPAVRVDELPSAAPAAPPPRRPSADSALAPQLAAIDRAHDALASGDAASALRELDAFDAKHPGSSLAEEAAVLRFDALVARGDAAAARRAARAFIGRWPSSPYAGRLRRTMDSSE